MLSKWRGPQYFRDKPIEGGHAGGPKGCGGDKARCAGTVGGWHTLACEGPTDGGLGVCASDCHMEGSRSFSDKPTFFAARV